jgi:hypothetical protein
MDQRPDAYGIACEGASDPMPPSRFPPIRRRIRGVIEDCDIDVPILSDTALAECERAGGADPNLFRILG